MGVGSDTREVKRRKVVLEKRKQESASLIPRKKARPREKKRNKRRTRRNSLHTHSCECLKSELFLFAIPPTQTTIENSHWIQYKPISSLTDDSPIEFVLPGTGEEYIDLAHTMLSLRVSLQAIVDVPQAATADVPKVGPVNNIMHSLFNQVDAFSIKNLYHRQQTLTLIERTLKLY